jgi:phage shock protein PspC (stress-responsive transcriptional regulator)
MFDRFAHHRPMISGVCAWMADQSAVPVWLIRIVALALAIAHGPLMIIGYFVAAYLIRREARVVGSAYRPNLPDRFSDLDRRMAEAEEAAWREEYRRTRG